MKRLFYCIAAILFFQISTHAQSYGLVFSSHEVVQEKRTSLDLSPDDSLCLANDFTLSFDINFLPHHEIYFGYIFRIIALGPGNEQNIDLIYNQALHAFKIIVGENFSGISFSLDSAKLYREWNRFSLHADLAAHTLQCTVNGRPVGASPIPAIGSCLRILWGANDFRKYRTRDIPPMELKDIALASGSRHYDWPLDGTTGETATDKGGSHPARVKNPNWLKPKYQHWELAGSFSVNGYAGIAYNPKQDKLYIAGDDSIAAYTFTKDGLTTEWIPTRHIEFPVGHQNIYDTLADRLLDVFIDRKTVSTFNPTTRQWDQNFTYGPLTEYWHANKFGSPADSSLYLIGGYGQLRYKNGVRRYHFPTHRWDTIRTTGDYLPPHYLSALGADEKFAYILGGYGSHTGDQMLDPRNYYDLFRFDIKHRSFKKLLTLKTPAYPYTFANSLILAPGGNWYGLIFPNDSYNSQLQLIKGSLTDSTYQPVATPIPYNFYDIQSFADLYYSPLSNKLIAVTLFYSKYTADDQKDKNTQVRIYTLNYPPEPAGPATANLSTTPARRSTWTPIIGTTLLLLLTVAGLTFRRTLRRKTAATTVIPTANTASTNTPSTNITSPGKTHTTAAPTSTTAVPHAPATTPEPPSSILEEEDSSQPIAGSYPASTIYLFGSFQTLDREGHDCTRLFTPLLKELFLLITTYTIRNGRGISSEGLNELLWHDKSEKDAKNNRSVNLAKLKPILEKIGACSINKEAGYWHLQTGEDIFLDYKRLATLLHETTPPDTHGIHALIDIVRRGPFLLQTEYNWLDDIKSAVSNAVIDRCLQYLRLQDTTANPEFIIEIANCIFFFDQLNEDALTIKCKSLIHLKRHNLASNAYLKFAKDYKDIYNAEFPRSFQQIIA